MQQRNTAVVDMEAKLSEMKSKSDEYTDKVWSCCTLSLSVQFVYVFDSCKTSQSVIFCNYFHRLMSTTIMDKKLSFVITSPRLSSSRSVADNAACPLLRTV